jgi:hypothetical protein
MEIRPIRNDADHEAALREIESLWDAKPGTKKHDRLEVLAILVQHYEAEHRKQFADGPLTAEGRLRRLGLERNAFERRANHAERNEVGERCPSSPVQVRGWRFFPEGRRAEQAVRGVSGRARAQDSGSEGAT